jgi:hypothetical protein
MRRDISNLPPRWGSQVRRQTTVLTSCDMFVAELAQHPAEGPGDRRDQPQMQEAAIVAVEAALILLYAQEQKITR